MSYPPRLPTGLEPVRVINLCSNRFDGVSIPLAFQGQPVFLVGRGSIPQIWLAAPVDPSGGLWDFIVAFNSPRNPAVAVKKDNKKREVTVQVAGTIVIRARAISDDSVTIDQVDFRPIGLDVRGDSDHLSVGGARLAGNIFMGPGGGISLGEQA